MIDIAEYNKKVGELLGDFDENVDTGTTDYYFKTQLVPKISAIIRRNLTLYYTDGYFVDYGCGVGEYGTLLNNYFTGGVSVDRANVLSNLDGVIKYAYDGTIGDFDFEDLITEMESTIIDLPCSLVTFNEVLHLSPPWQIKKILSNVEGSNIPYILVTENQATERNANLDDRLKKLTDNGQLYEKSHMEQILRDCNYLTVETMETDSHYMILAKHQDY